LRNKNFVLQNIKIVRYTVMYQYEKCRFSSESDLGFSTRQSGEALLRISRLILSFDYLLGYDLNYIS